MTLLILAFHAFDGGGTFLPGVHGFARTCGNEPAGCRGCCHATFGGQSAPAFMPGLATSADLLTSPLSPLMAAPCNTACTAAPLSAVAIFAEKYTTTPAAIPASKHCAAGSPYCFQQTLLWRHPVFYSGS